MRFVFSGIKGIRIATGPLGPRNDGLEGGPAGRFINHGTVPYGVVAKSASSVSACGENSIRSLAPPFPTKAEDRLCGAPIKTIPPRKNGLVLVGAAAHSRPRGGTRKNRRITFSPRRRYEVSRWGRPSIVRKAPGGIQGEGARRPPPLVVERGGVQGERESKLSLPGGFLGGLGGHSLAAKNGTSGKRKAAGGFGTRPYGVSDRPRR